MSRNVYIMVELHETVRGVHHQVAAVRAPTRTTGLLLLLEDISSLIAPVFQPESLLWSSFLLHEMLRRRCFS